MKSVGIVALSFVCEYCNQQFSDKSECMEHEKEHKEDRELIDTLQVGEEVKWRMYQGSDSGGPYFTNALGIVVKKERERVLVEYNHGCSQWVSAYEIQKAKRYAD